MQGLRKFELLHMTFLREVVENQIMRLMGTWVQLAYEEGVVRGRPSTGHFRGHRT